MDILGSEVDPDTTGNGVGRMDWWLERSGSENVRGAERFDGRIYDHQ